MNKLYFTRVVEMTGGLFTSSTRQRERERERDLSFDAKQFLLHDIIDFKKKTCTVVVVLVGLVFF